MQRKPGFPASSCNIKMPDGAPSMDLMMEDEVEPVQRRQQLINFGHSQWGFNNWSWSVTKQELDFADFANGKYCAGVVAFVSVTVKSIDVHRENIGYATSLAANKGAAIHKSRKCAVTNALRETLLSFGGSVASELMELLDAHKTEIPAPTPAPEPENNPNVANKHTEPKNVTRNIRKDSFDGCSNMRPPVIESRPPVPPIPAIKNAPPVKPPVRAPPPRPAAAAAPPRNPNEPRPDSEEARAERKRRQQRAQELFRMKQAAAAAPRDHADENQEAAKPHSSGFDSLLMEIPTQDIEITHSGDEGVKRTSPAADPHNKRRATTMNRLDIVAD